MIALDALRMATALRILKARNGPVLSAQEQRVELQARIEEAGPLGWDEFFPVTASELGSRPPILMGDLASYWVNHATTRAVFLLDDYERGEIDLKQLLLMVRSSTVFCDAEVRAALIGWTVEQARGIRPRVRKGKKRQYPRSLRVAAASVVHALRSHLGSVGVKLRADPLRDDGQLTVIRAALGMLPALGLSTSENPVTEEMLYRWFLDLNKLMGKSAPRGRPRRRRNNVGRSRQTA